MENFGGREKPLHEMRGHAMQPTDSVTLPQSHLGPALNPVMRSLSPHLKYYANGLQPSIDKPSPGIIIVP